MSFVRLNALKLNPSSLLHLHSGCWAEPSFRTEEWLSALSGIVLSQLHSLKSCPLPGAACIQWPIDVGYKGLGPLDPIWDSHWVAETIVETVLKLRCHPARPASSASFPQMRILRVLPNYDLECWPQPQRLLRREASLQHSFFISMCTG